MDPYPLTPQDSRASPPRAAEAPMPQAPPIQWQQAGAITSTIVRCVGCGYDLSGAPVGGACAECGLPVERSLAAVGGGRSCGLATACMVVGICSLAVCLPCGPVAIIMYYRAMREMSAGGYAKTSYTLAKTGLILGIIASCILVLYIGFFGIVALGGL